MPARSRIARVLRASAISCAMLTASSPMAVEAQGTAGAPRRVWADTGLFLGFSNASADGRFVSNQDLRWGNIWIRDLTTGRMRALTDQSPQKQTGYGLESLFSPDGREVAYTWFDIASGAYQVRITGVDSTGLRVLYPGDTTTQFYVAVMDWSPDGKHIAAALQLKDKSWQLVLIPSSGGATRLIRTFADWRPPTNVRVSPDGRHVAYSYPPKKDDGQRDIYLLSLTENREQVVARHVADDVVLGWSESGSELVFSSERAGSPGVWRVGVDGGRSSGDARLIRGDLWRLQPLRATPSGQVFYIVQAGDANVYVAPFDAVTGRLQSTPVSVTRSPGASFASPAWSADGKYVAYLSFGGDFSRVGSTKLTIRSLESGEQRSFQPPFGYLRRILWMPDGRSLLLSAADDKGITTAFRMDLATGDAERLVDQTISATVSPDGRTLYFSTAVPGSPAGARGIRRLAALDLSTRKERDLYVAPVGTRVSAAYARFEPNLQVTRDGKHVVFVVAPADSNASTIAVVPAVGGEIRTMPSPSGLRFSNIRLVGFSPDGEELLFTALQMIRDNPQPASFWRVSLASGKFARLESPGTGDVGIAVSPDGRRLAFTAGSTAAEMWVLEDPSLRRTAVGTGRR